MPARCLVCLLAVLPLRAADTDAIDLLTKSVAAFQQNWQNEKNWNWTTSEVRRLTDRSGKPVQTLPQVRSESVMLGSGVRCNAVTFWGDGHEPYKKDASPEERCQNYNALGTPFDVVVLLKSATAKIASRSADSVTVAVTPDKSRQKDHNYAVSCGASIEATIKLDAKTSFPLTIEGRVADSGCNTNFMPVMQGDTAIDRGPMSSNFRKGSTFRIEWKLQKDRFENPANSFWIVADQHYDQPISDELTVLYYWGRQFRIQTSHAYRLIKDVTTTAQEFGVGSQLTFK
jgi:hypothetical protein